MGLLRSSMLHFAVMVIAMCAGCQPRSLPPALPTPTTLLTLDYSSVPVTTAAQGLATTPTTSTTTAPTTAPTTSPSPDPLSALSVDVTFIATEKIPETTYEPVVSKANLLSSSGGAVAATAELTQDATISVNPPATAGQFATALHYFHGGRVTKMGTLTAALPAGVTADFAAQDPDTVADLVAGTTTRRKILLQVSRPDSTTNYQLVLVVRDVSGNKETPGLIRTESATFNRSDPNTAIVIPFRFDSAISRAIGILVHVSPGPADLAHADATANCIRQITSSATTKPVPVTGEASALSAMTAAVQSLTPVAGRRSALAFLADQTGASLCEDVAMEADDSVLAQLVTNIQTKVAVEKSTDPIPDRGWLLDLTALQLLTRLSDDAANGTGKISPELTAVLTNHTGEVGRHSSSLEEVLRGLSTRQELDNRLLAENTIFLEDSSPASRVRAFDWLTARHHAPEGFDPLADPISRRNALERAAGPS